MIKKDPIYRITIYTQEETIIIQSPITCQISVTRNVHADSCRASVQLYNLAPSTRASIFQDIFVAFDNKTWKYLQIEAGYGGNYDNMSLIFMGRILQAYSHKSGGATDIVTDIQAQALDLLDCNTSHSFAAGTSYKDIYNTIAQDMPNCIIGNTGALEGEIKTQTTFDGNAFEEINKITGGNTFIDNGVLNTIFNNEVIDVPVPVISDDAGLLETPMRRDASLTIKSIFLPELIIGQLLEIRSRIFNNYNGQFKVMGFTHNCLFSPTQAGTRTTDVEMWIGDLLPGAVIDVTGEKTQNNFNKVKGEKIEPVTGNAPGTVREIYNQIKKNNGIVPSIQLTKNINWREVLVNANRPNEINQDLTLGIMTNVYYICKYFQQVIDNIYSGREVKINSCFRTKANNTRSGGVPNSRHLQGLAIDFVVKGVPLSEQKIKFKNVWNGKVLTNYATFIHVQLSSTKGFANDK